MWNYRGKIADTRTDRTDHGNENATCKQTFAQFGRFWDFRMLLAFYSVGEVGSKWTGVRAVKLNSKS